ncbi:DNA repair and recombination protein rad54b [Entophlyctis luteolus]|nr:DNA repair and recombination protein rad54b [Entophlyctis luteolus]
MESILGSSKTYSNKGAECISVENIITKEELTLTNPSLHQSSEKISDLMKRRHEDDAPAIGRVFNVTMRKRQAPGKKHKTWDDDAILVSKPDGSASVVSLDGKEITRTASFVISSDPLDDSVYSIGGREIQISGVVPWDAYMAGSCFLSTVAPASPLIPRVAQPIFISPIGKRATGKFKAPSFVGNVSLVSKPQVVKPRHDPKALGAIVMARPPGEETRPIVDVVIDPFLSGNLRPHQVEGVRFLYDCVMGFKEFNGHGAILADEMGTISYGYWLFLKTSQQTEQSPYANTPPPVKRALIICPATLCQNWKNEFSKWLGDERIRVFVLDDKNSKIHEFTVGRVYNVLICGYERLRVCKDAILNAGFDIVIADEGHRLKNTQIQAFKIISGEFYAICDLVNPGILGSRTTFSGIYENPIIASRDPSVNEEEILLGQKASLPLLTV